MASYKVYDHRVKQAIVRTKNPNLFPDLEIPVTTARGWIKNGIRDVVSIAELDDDRVTLIEKIASLEKQVRTGNSRNELVLFTFRLFGLQIQYQRLPHADAKSALIDQIRKAAAFMPLSECLEAIGLSAARFHNWIKRQIRCLLTDQTSCPKLSPTQLTPAETSAIKDLVTSKEHVHFSIPSLAWFARREGKVFASLSSWYRVVAEHGLKRPLKRLYPPKPKVGIRATAPNLIWRLDQTLIRLENGTRIYLQSIVDNFSRFILAWAATPDYGARRTRSLLERAVTTASEFFPNMIPLVMVDSGSENLNGEVDTLVDGGVISRVVAQIEIEFSNSMVEAFFRSIKHRWLYLISLTTFEQAYAAIEKYMLDYSHRIPLNALAGGTPFEVWSGKWTEQTRSDLRTIELAARVARMKSNLSVSCGVCPE